MSKKFCAEESGRIARRENTQTVREQGLVASGFRTMTLGMGEACTDTTTLTSRDAICFGGKSNFRSECDGMHTILWHMTLER